MQRADNRKKRKVVTSLHLIGWSGRVAAGKGRGRSPSFPRIWLRCVSLSLQEEDGLVWSRGRRVESFGLDPGKAESWTLGCVDEIRGKIGEEERMSFEGKGSHPNRDKKVH